MALALQGRAPRHRASGRPCRVPESSSFSCGIGDPRGTFYVPPVKGKNSVRMPVGCESAHFEGEQRRRALRPQDRRSSPSANPETDRYCHSDVPRPMPVRGRPPFLIQTSGFGEGPGIVPLEVCASTLVLGLPSPKFVVSRPCWATPAAVLGRTFLPDASASTRSPGALPPALPCA